MPAFRCSPCLLLLACLAALTPRLQSADRPNIIFMMSDDHAAHALSCYGSKVNQTPGLDRIASDGIRFDRAFVTNSICTPSRATLLTGKYSHLNGSPVFNRFDGAQPNVAKLMRDGGYHTVMVGKWHLGSDPTGFDNWIVLPGQGVYHNPKFLTPAGRLDTEGFVSDVTLDLGIRLIEERPKDKPFFLMLHQKAPHRGWEPDEKNKALFKDRIIPMPSTLSDDYHSRPAALPKNRQTIAHDLNNRDLKLTPPEGLKPAERQKWLNEVPESVDLLQTDGSAKTLTGEALIQWKYQRYMQDYLACVQGVDDNTGRLLDYLETTGLAKNTVVFYTSDNGFFLGDNGMFDKRYMYEPSLRVPLMIRAPGLTRPGSVSDRIVINTDLAPTFLDLAGLPVPADMQGRSLKPILAGNTPDDWRKDMYYRYYHDPGHHNTAAHLGIRTDTDKLLHYWKLDAWEYFDLTTDPDEQRNRIDDPTVAARVAELKTGIRTLQLELHDFGQFSREIPKDNVDGGWQNLPALGLKSINEAVALSKAS